MGDDISTQIWAQTSENIAKLFDLSTRIDERVKAIQQKQEHLEKRLDDHMQNHVQLLRNVAVLETRNEGNVDIVEHIEEISNQLTDIDKRLSRLENDEGRQNERWKTIVGFIVQLLWVVTAAYLLMKLNLQAPAVP